MAWKASKLTTIPGTVHSICSTPNRIPDLLLQDGILLFRVCVPSPDSDIIQMRIMK